MISFVTHGAACTMTKEQLAGIDSIAPTSTSASAHADVADALREVHALLVAADEPVVLISGEVALHEEAIRELVLDPRARTAAAVSRVSLTRDIRLRGGHVVSAGSAMHSVSDPDAAFAGIIVVAAVDLRAAARAVARMATVTPRSAAGDPMNYVLVALVRGGLRVTAVDVDPWPWLRATSEDEVATFTATAAVVDAPTVRLARALRPDDGFYSTFVVRRLSRRLTPIALRLGLRPNQITVASLGIGLAAAVAFSTGARVGLVAGALLLQLSLVVDCVDGEVARYTRGFSALGAWLDASTDRVKEYACYAGLAFGAAELGPVDPWLLAAAMLSLQTARHTSDYTFTLVKNVREGMAETVPLEQRDDVIADGPTESAAVRAVRASARSNERPAIRWMKKAVYLPIGERWLVISLAAAFGSAYWVFASLLVLGTLALVYTTSARLLRSKTWTAASATELERQVVQAQLDRGPLASAAARALPWRLPAGRLAWTMPAVLRAVEFTFVVLTVRRVAPESMPAAFALLFVIAYHHYDALYRVLNGLASAGSLRLVGLGVEGRMLVISALAIAGSQALTQGLVLLVVALGVLFIGMGTAGGLHALRVPHGERLPGKAIGV